MSNKKLIEKMRKVVEKRGKKAYETAKEAILKERFEYEAIHEALLYFMGVWPNFHHPALLSLACESVGGNPETTVSIGASIVLLTGAADIHDDIIDQSATKNSKTTVLGKFGRDIALLVGDALLLGGCTFLDEACENLPKKQRKTVVDLVKKAFSEMSGAEAEEASLKGNWNVKPEDYLNVMRRKAAIADMVFRIGAILGDASPEEIETLGNYGRILGILANLRDEFVDIFESKELENRAENECLPLPILYAFCDKAVKEKIIPILRKKDLKDKDAFDIADIVMATEGVLELKKEMDCMLERGIKCLGNIKDVKITHILDTLLEATVEDLWTLSTPRKSKT
jgi:geranylgeranyl pyrophosphate synthase